MAGHSISSVGIPSTTFHCTFPHTILKQDKTLTFPGFDLTRQVRLYNPLPNYATQQAAVGFSVFLHADLTYTCLTALHMEKKKTHKGTFIQPLYAKCNYCMEEKSQKVPPVKTATMGNFIAF